MRFQASNEICVIKSVFSKNLLFRLLRQTEIMTYAVFIGTVGSLALTFKSWFRDKVFKKQWKDDEEHQQVQDVQGADLIPIQKSCRASLKDEFFWR